MNDFVDAKPPVTQQEKKLKTLPRRTFLRASVHLLGGFVAACVPQNLLTPVPRTRTPVAFPTPKEHPVISTKEIPAPREEQVIINYQRLTQQMYENLDSSGKRVVVPRGTPEADPAENGGGFVYNTEEFDWSKLQLPEIRIKGSRLPLLTSRTDIDSQTIEFLESWYQDPQFVEKKIHGIKLSPSSQPIHSLVIHYKSIRDDYWQLNARGEYEKVFNNTPGHDPQQLHGQLINSLVESTDGAINYHQVGMEELDEGNFPLTEDQSLTYPDLLVAYKRTINYQKLAELAVKNKATTVFVYAGSSGGMLESALWTDKTSGKQIQIFGLNYDHSYASAFHSWTHFLEAQIRASAMGDIYLKCVGRDQEYQTLPYANDPYSSQNTLKMNDGRIYASIGVGTVHLAPNSVYHNEYNSPIPVMLPGQETPVNMSLWGGDELNYYPWWLKSLPRSFLSVVR